MKLFQLIAKNINWLQTVNENYKDQCLQNLYKCEKLLPHGSGIDCGCEIDLEQSKPEKIVITFSFHHMDEYGFYCGWTNYRVILKPDFVNGFNMRIVGKNTHMIKDYLYNTFDYILNENFDL